MRAVLLTLALALVVPAVPAAGAVASPAPAASPSARPSAAAVAAVHVRTKRKVVVPKLKIRSIVRDLDHPWDVRPLPDGSLLYTQRDRATLSVLTGGQNRTLTFPSADVWVSGETGLLGLEVDPDFTTNRRIYTCQGGFTGGGGHDVRVMAWTLDAGLTTATSAGQVVGGLPTSSGRHGGCRLLVDTAGSLLIGTGDAAVGTNPENLNSLGGKTLRVDRFTGAPWPTNPFAGASSARRFVQSYGHRNVQGLAQRADGTLWSVEQGTGRDDEVNLLKNGGDYGYNPVPGYNESVPMTDQSLPGPQVNARWRSGNPTVATSGGGFVPVDASWGALSGNLAVACLKASKVLFLKFSSSGRLVKVRRPTPLAQYGRIRTVVPDGNHLLVLTDNGGGTDKILRVTPR